MIEGNSRVVAIVPANDLVRLTHIIYLLHGFSIMMGILGPALIITTFLTGWPSIIAVIINYVKRHDVRGTYLEFAFWLANTNILVYIALGGACSNVVRHGGGYRACLYSRCRRGYLGFLPHNPWLDRAQ